MLHSEKEKNKIQIKKLQNSYNVSLVAVFNFKKWLCAAVDCWLIWLTDSIIIYFSILLMLSTLLSNLLYWNFCSHAAQPTGDNVGDVSD